MTTANVHGEFKLVDDCAGSGELACGAQRFVGVGYSVRRYQGMSRSGLPIPGLHRIEGRIDLASLGADSAQVLQQAVVLHLEDGRAWRVRVLGDDGSILAEGHGPSRCSCC